MSKFREQYERMRRGYERFAAIDQGLEHFTASDNYIDEIYAFFQNCYHLKDWIRNDSSVPDNARSDVEVFINSSQPLRLCADICNTLKHLTLTRSRSDQQPSFGPKHFALEIGGAAKPTIRLKYEVTTASGSEDAFSLATDCVSDWDGFLQRHHL